MQGLLNQSIGVYSQLRDELSVLLDQTRSIDPTYYTFASNQLNYFSDRCQSVNLLLQCWKLWDADILMRSSLECFTRFVFVGIANPSERERRIYEYTFGLNEIEEIQRSEKAKIFVSEGAGDIESMLIGGVVLPPERETELRERWPKSKRNIVKQKWSFSEMARQIARFKNDSLDLTGYKACLYSYGRSSHLIHADQTAIQLMSDRESRSPEVRNLLEKAHYARLASEQPSMLFICWRVMAHAMGFDSRSKKIEESLRELHHHAHVYQEEFANTQDHLYGPPREAAPFDGNNGIG